MSRQRPRPHDTPGGVNPDIADIEVEVLADAWYVLRRATFRHRLADGSWRREQREAYDRGNGVCALLRDPARDTVLLVRQYRLPAHLNEHPDGMLLELPAGLIDADEHADEDAGEAMRRELVEEVGHDIADLTRLWRLYMSPGSVTEHITFFLGTYGEHTRVHAGGGMDDEHERIEVVELTVDDATAMIVAGEIVDAKTVLALTQLALTRLAAAQPRT
jgi:nudix-type nucleoside diphosphatase (YffH/AdpP family)